MVGVYLLCLGPSPTAAQVNGHVVDEVNAPVQGATVELWSPTRRLVARLSDAEGRFSFPASDMGGAVGALAHRIGMRAAQASLAPVDGERVLRLASEVIAFDHVMVTAARPTRLCPNRDDPEARALWNAARSRYGGPPGRYQVHIAFEQHTAEVPRDRIGSAGAEPLQPGSQMTRLAFDRGWNDRVHCGYGCRIEQSFDLAYALWRYLPLESHYPQHLLTDLFSASATRSASLPTRATTRCWCSARRSRGTG